MVHCSTQHTKSMPHAGHIHSAALWGKNTLPEPLMVIAPDFLFPYKAQATLVWVTFLALHHHSTDTVNVCKESCVSRGNALQLYQCRSARLHGPWVNSSCKHNSLTLPSEGKDISQTFLALIAGRGRCNLL